MSKCPFTTFHLQAHVPKLILQCQQQVGELLAAGRGGASGGGGRSPPAIGGGA